MTTLIQSVHTTRITQITTFGITIIAWTKNGCNVLSIVNRLSKFSLVHVTHRKRRYETTQASEATEEES